ncbi:MAG: hypothetical protein OEW13_09855, partial [Nitrospira sp.]|nr:hypothetical protein [Nitrospira sp.]
MATSVQRQRQALGRPTGFHKFIEVNGMGIVSSSVKPRLRGGTSYRKNDMFPNADGIAGELQGFIFGNSQTEPIRNAFGNGHLSVRIERFGKIEKFAAAQRTQAGVQVVKTAVDQFEGDDLSV